MRLKIGVSAPSSPNSEREILAHFDYQSKDTFITKSLLARIPNTSVQGTRSYPLSGYGYRRFSVDVPTIDLCLRHGQTRIIETALIVDDPPPSTHRVIYPEGYPLEGYHDEAEKVDLSLGVGVIERILGATPEPLPSHTPNRHLIAAQEPAVDPTAFKLSLYPIDTEAVSALDLVQFLDAARRLYNIFIFLEENTEVTAHSTLQVEELVLRDIGLPPDSMLRIARVDHGSIIVTLKSGVIGALSRLASLFRRYSENIEAQSVKALAEARKSSVEAEVREATTQEAIERAKSEEQAATAENRRKTYDQYRQGILGNAAALDELLARVEDNAIREKMRALKDQALLQLAERLILPLASKRDDFPGIVPPTAVALPPAEPE